MACVVRHSVGKFRGKGGGIKPKSRIPAPPSAVLFASLQQRKVGPRLLSNSTFRMLFTQPWKHGSASASDRKHQSASDKYGNYAESSRSHGVWRVWGGTELKIRGGGGGGIIIIILCQR